ncbi:MAG TPA: rod shape-determining protein RodA [Candidatus Hypogeohydataceae bacterium YC41]
MLSKRLIRGFDWLVFISICGLFTIGFFFIWSAASQGHAFKQLIWMGLGLGVFFGLLFLNYLTIVRHAYIYYLLGIISLAAVLFLGASIRGSRRWFDLGPINFQPSEFIKIILVLALARYLMYKNSYKKFHVLAVSLAFTIVPLILILMEPDLGTGMTLLPIFFAMVFVTGARIKHFLLLIPIALASLPLMWFVILKGYQKDRFLGFIWANTDQDLGTTYHRLQALIAVGSGGVLGQGWGQGVQTQLRGLPEAHTDFIFAAIAEEWGFLRTLLVILLFMAFLAGTLGIARRTRDPVGRLILTGLAAMFASQGLINMSMVLGLAPITGINLPFVSYGGSSLLSSFIALSLIINVGMRSKVVLSKEDFC